jgi:hypothetical protein
VADVFPRTNEHAELRIINWEVGQGAPIVPAPLRESARIGPVAPGDVLVVAAIDENLILHVLALNLAATPTPAPEK